MGVIPEVVIKPTSSSIYENTVLLLYLIQSRKMVEGKINLKNPKALNRIFNLSSFQSCSSYLLGMNTRIV